MTTKVITETPTIIAMRFRAIKEAQVVTGWEISLFSASKLKRRSNGRKFSVGISEGRNRSNNGYFPEAVDRISREFWPNLNEIQIGEVRSKALEARRRKNAVLVVTVDDDYKPVFHIQKDTT